MFRYIRWFTFALIPGPYHSIRLIDQIYRTKNQIFKPIKRNGFPTKKIFIMLTNFQWVGISRFRKNNCYWHWRNEEEGKGAGERGRGDGGCPSVEAPHGSLERRSQRLVGRVSDTTHIQIDNDWVCTPKPGEQPKCPTVLVVQAAPPPCGKLSPENLGRMRTTDNHSHPPRDNFPTGVFIRKCTSKLRTKLTPWHLRGQVFR